MPDGHERPPAGERLASLEESARGTREDISEMKQDMRKLADAVQRVEQTLAQRRGAERFVRGLLDAVKVIGGGAAGAGLAQWWHH